MLFQNEDLIFFGIDIETNTYLLFEENNIKYMILNLLSEYQEENISYSISYG